MPQRKRRRIANGRKGIRCKVILILRAAINAAFSDIKAKFFIPMGWNSVWNGVWNN
jgi:hypothetical protein